LTSLQNAPFSDLLIVMAKSDMRVPRRWGGLSVHARGHFLLFDKRSAFHWNAETGACLLFIAVAIEAVRIVAIEWLYAVLPLLILVLLLLAGALGLVRFVARLRLSQIGLYPWSEWSPVEKSYFVQLMVITNVVFPLVFASRLELILARPSVVATVWSAFVPYLFFGFYQEVVYRGILQAEFVRRWGALAGILGANVFYTFGPLHWYYFAAQGSLAVPMFAAIFAIGLFFGVLFWRSGNLWIVAVIHGIGNAYIVGSLSAAR
jgi:membrane protease YdiL (CAAX protease family)